LTDANVRTTTRNAVQGKRRRANRYNGCAAAFRLICRKPAGFFAFSVSEPQTGKPIALFFC
jgi:hypothetical protein